MPLRSIATAFVVAAAVLRGVSYADDALSAPRLLETRCFECHGGDHREGGLYLRSRDDALLGGDSGEPAIVPGDASAGALIARITAADPADRMPPKGKPLTQDEVDTIRAWINAGASWGEFDAAGVPKSSHWAFQPPAAPALPEVRGDAWVRNPIDAFVLARLREEGLAPSPEADRNTLIRRVSLDLRGLPPTPEEVEAFVNDSRPDAYERLVDAFLASPHYGERMAVPWLDAARYADTNGFEKDRARPIWPYRDWVIQAFNDDKPYDQFIIEQLAGDLLPQATVEQHVATGFLRNSMINEEGGIDVEEYRYEAMVDRTNAVGTVMMGLTLACAQCHTHKYDPITQREYFEFYAFLNNTDDVSVTLPDAEIQAERDAIEAKIRAAVADLPNRFPLGKTVREDYALNPTAYTANEGTLDKVDGETLRLQDAAPDKAAYTITFGLDTRPINGLTIHTIPDETFPQGGAGRAVSGNFVVTEVRVSYGPLEEGAALQPVTLARAVADHAQPGYPADHAIDGNPGTGWAVGGAESSPHTLTLWFDAPLEVNEISRLQLEIDQNHGGQHLIGQFRVDAVMEYLPPSDAPDDVRRARYLEQRFTEWKDETRTKAVPWTVLRPVEMHSKNHATLTVLDDQSILASGDIPNVDTYDLAFFADLENITAIRIEALPHESLPNGGPGRGVIMSKGGDFLLSEVAVEAAPWENPEAVNPVALQNASEDYAAPDRTAAHALDGKLDTGWSVKDREGQPHAAVFEFTEPVGTAGGTLLKLKLDQYYVHQHTLGRLRISATTAALPVKASGVPADIEEALLANPPSDAQTEALRAHFLSVAPELADAHTEIAALKASMPELPTSLTLAERANPRVTHIHHRGEFLSPRATVQPDVLAVLPPLPEHGPRNRLMLAQWLVSPEHPLTSRVIVNRLWQQVFGRGIVPTVDDFGTRGETPSHPDLLDWLALEFQRRGWSIKEMMRLMVTSSTYRQSSRVTPELLEHDPENTLLARGPRFRVPAEFVRDIALASSGLLTETVGGPSVYPPMPPGVLSIVYAGGWDTDEGEDRYRRGLYTFWKRTLPYPSATVFDAPARDMACVRRVQSNTPLQALTLLNDTVFVEAARAMAARLLQEAPADDAARIDHLFMLCLARNADDLERAWVQEFLTLQRERLAQSGAPSDIALGGQVNGTEVQELAAWTLVCRAILNLDETISKT